MADASTVLGGAGYAPWKVEHALSPRAAAARRNSARSRRKPEQFSRSDCTLPQGIIEECIWTFRVEDGR
jgi:hypothetical protein